MALNIGRKGRLYIKKEVTYGTSPVLAATDAVRHIDVGFMFDPFGRVTSQEKQQVPGPINRFDRKKTASFDLKSALLRPSGTLNTVPEADELLEVAMGAVTNVTLATTVNAGTGTVGGATLASAAGLAVGDAVSIVVNGLKYVRFIQTLPGGGVVTWAPNLPSGPADGAAVKGGITYKLTTDNAKSLTAAHYLAGFNRELNGIAIDALNLTFDANEEPKLSATGPAKAQVTPAQAQPGAFTTVGGHPPSGLVGELLVGNNAYLFKKLEAQATMGMRLRDQEYGVNGATEAYRAARRAIELTLEAFAETEATLYDLAEAGTNAGIFKQTGRTEGNIIACYWPRVEFKIPDQDDGDEEVNWTFKGTALASADGQNDEFFLALL